MKFYKKKAMIHTKLQMVFQALEMAQEELLDLVLLDMKIPGMDGIEILKRLKAIEPDNKGHYYDSLRMN